METKKKILSTAIHLFNEHGFHQVTLADIAKACDMSRGNLAYHYKKKLYLLNELAITMVNEVKHMQSKRKDYPAFSNLTLDVRTCKTMQDRYKFIFRDSSVLEHKNVQQVMRIISKIAIQRNKEAFAYGVLVGNLKEEQFGGMYSHLAINTWLVTYYWLAQHSMRDVGAEEEAEKTVWATILPYFTERGIEAFESFYGKEYMHGLGKGIQQEVEQRILF